METERQRELQRRWNEIESELERLWQAPDYGGKRAKQLEAELRRIKRELGDSYE